MINLWCLITTNKQNRSGDFSPQHIMYLALHGHTELTCAAKSTRIFLKMRCYIRLKCSYFNLGTKRMPVCTDASASYILKVRTFRCSQRMYFPFFYKTEYMYIWRYIYTHSSRLLQQFLIVLSKWVGSDRKYRDIRSSEWLCKQRGILWMFP